MSREINYVDFNGTVAKTNRPSALEADRYTSADYFHQEWENVWRKSWLLAGMEADIPETGDYFIFELAQESIIITRTENGEIKASFNACKHRGNKIFTNERGAVEKITFPYHGLNY
ncbi:MAG: Rieske 2Fe-2S domain-containing protein [Alphaproteobacteria bacterium]|nr:Rieske 2Fe-2S domain-containing protein [Alphaproteobacteria bacterium]